MTAVVIEIGSPVIPAFDWIARRDQRQGKLRSRGLTANRALHPKSLELRQVGPVLFKHPVHHFAYFRQ